MDQDSTKDGTGGGDRRNWRERLGVGQDLPKISDEFKPMQRDPQPADGDAPPAVQSGAQPGAQLGTPVARPAPMAPRYARPTAPRPGNGSSPEHETQEPKPAEAARGDAGSRGLRPWATSSQQAHKPAETLRHQRPMGPMGEAGRPGAGNPPSSAASSAPGTERPSYSPRTSPLPGAQRSAPSRGPAAYAQAAARSGAAPSAAASDSFGERLRAQREAAEKLAQQRLAAVRDRSGHAGADALTMLTPRKANAAPQGKTAPGPEANAKPAGGEQPRFTFAQEEIVAAQQETAFNPDAQPAAGGRQHQSPAANVHDRGESAPQSAPEAFMAGTPEYPPEYRHEDEGMFEDEQPSLQAVPARASAADYSAAYREFEDEFEDEPRRGGGPMLLLLSLAALAVVSGGVIYWYQQLEGSPAPEARDLPVISAPQEPAKAEPPPQQQQPQQAAQPATRKQIYDRIIGEETLEPERIVPTEEEPQLRQIQQPDPQQQPRASGEDQSLNPGAPQQNQSTEPLPLPLPPPPGTGEQGDLLVPGMADTQTASASPEPAELTFPEPGVKSALARDEADAPIIQQAAVLPASGEPAPLSRATATRAEMSDTAAAPASEAAVRSSIYPEPDEPLAYPGTKVESAAQGQTPEPEEAKIAAVAEPEPEPEVDEKLEAEPDVEQASDVPLPRAKPEPPAVKTAAKQAPQAQPKRQTAQPSGSGPVQIIPADVASGRAPAQARAAQQPQARPSIRARTVGRDYDPVEDKKLTFRRSPSAQAAQPAAPQQVASVAPDAPSRQTQSAGGYVVQVASFRSESEALSEYKRLVQRHPQLVSGLGSRVQEASLGESGSFFRLGVGPLPDRSAATKLCNDLIAAGEKDCLVRRR